MDGIVTYIQTENREGYEKCRSAILLQQIAAGTYQRADDPVAEGVANAGEMLAIARRRFAGACLMPPFDHYEVLLDILKDKDEL